MTLPTTPDSQPAGSQPTAVEVLKELEWSEWTSSGGFGLFPACPMCEQSREAGHTADCLLAAALATDTTAIGLEPPGCPIPGACSCPGGEAELAKRLGEARRTLAAANARIAELEEVLSDIAQGLGKCRMCGRPCDRRSNCTPDDCDDYCVWESVDPQERARAVLHADKPAVASTEGAP